VKRIPKVAAASRRVAMYEVRYCPDVPNNAAISAAVELAKGYEDEKVVSFLNGILGSFSRDEASQ
jgi:N utilization substance protein B